MTKFIPTSLLFTIFIFILIGLFRLQEISAAWFRDISIVNNYVQSILSGKFPLYLVTGAGPLYFYLISPLIAAFGVSYLNYKLISVGIGAIGLIAFYLFAKEISSKLIAGLTVTITAFSFWYIVWARLGNYNIAAPVVTALMMYFFIKYTKTYNLKWLLLSVFTSGLGLLIYAGTFILPVVLFILLMLEMMVRGKTFEIKRFFIILLSYLPLVVIFLLLIAQNSDNFTNGYLGTKIFNNMNLSTRDFWSRLFNNISRTATMLHMEGDIVFRWNVSKMPLLDKVSGIYFLIGLVAAFFRDRKYLIYILLPMLILPIPSVLPGHPEIEIPNSPRTMTIMPFVFLLVALGIECARLLIQKRLGAIPGISVTAISIILIAVLNLNNYFVLYPTGLPNKNTPFEKITAEYIDSLPANTEIYFASLGWGDWGQPEYDSIYWSLKNKKRTILIGAPNCDQKPAQFFSVILAPDQQEQIDNLKHCFPQADAKQYIVNEQVVFLSITNLPDT